MPSTPAKKLTGRPSKFRGKVRTRPVVITLTPVGHECLANGMTNTTLSTADYIELLLRRSPDRHARATAP